MSDQQPAEHVPLDAHARACLEGLRDETVGLKKQFARMHDQCRVLIIRLDQALAEKEFADPRAQRTTKLERPKR